MDVKIGSQQFRFIHDEVILDPLGPREQYNGNYFEEFKRRADSDIGRKLYAFRRSYVETFGNPGPVLDYGCGYGEIVCSDTTGRWMGYDVMKATVEKLGPKYDANYLAYDTLCLFDVLEHLTDPVSFVRQLRPGVRLIVTVPCWEHWDELDRLPGWKHFKPGEHLMYASADGLIGMLGSLCGCRLLDTNCLETELGREDVQTFCWQRSGW